jgi:hypothetical protein
MAINQNHICEELGGIKCAIVEKNAGKERVDFLERILTLNGFKVISVPSPPPKPPAQIAPTAPAAPAAPPLPATDPPPPAAIQPNGDASAVWAPASGTFTVGVTDLGFNPINAIFGRLLRTIDGHVVTLSYWQQKERESHDEIPYFEAG